MKHNVRIAVLIMITTRSHARKNPRPDCTVDCYRRHADENTDDCAMYNQSG